MCQKIEDQIKRKQEAVRVRKRAMESQKGLKHEFRDCGRMPSDPQMFDKCQTVSFKDAVAKQVRFTKEALQG